MGLEAARVVPLQILPAGEDIPYSLERSSTVTALMERDISRITKRIVAVGQSGIWRRIARFCIGIITKRDVEAGRWKHDKSLIGVYHWEPEGLFCIIMRKTGKFFCWLGVIACIAFLVAGLIYTFSDWSIYDYLHPPWYYKVGLVWVIPGVALYLLQWKLGEGKHKWDGMVANRPGYIAKGEDDRG